MVEMDPVTMIAGVACSLVALVLAWRAYRGAAADVTFTSRQQPQDGPSGESCTNWQITMFLDDNAGTYTIGAPAAGYAASYQPCS